MEIKIEQPHGYLLDADGKVIDRFGNWETGYAEVHPATDSIEYVEGPSSHDEPIHEDYKSDLS